MRIGIPKEIKDHEYRVGVTPAGVSAITAHGHEVLVETLAGARIGSVIASDELVAMLKRCQAPYPLAQPAVQAALAALAPQAVARAASAAAQLISERERLRDALQGAPGVRCVYPSQGNFLLVRFDDAQAAFDALLSAGVVVRDMRAAPSLADALRISIGTPEQNQRVLASLAVARQAA